MNIAYVPSSKVYDKNRIFFDGNDRDNVREPYVLLKEKCKINSWQINTIDFYSNLSDIDIIIIARFEYNFKIILSVLNVNPYVKIIKLITEEQNIAPLYTENILRNSIFDFVLTWRDDIVDNKYFLKYFYPNPIREMIKPIDFNQKKYLAIINSNKQHNKQKNNDLYPERIKAIQYFALNSNIDLYGMGWETSKDSIVKSVYLGPVESKIETLKNYKYAIAFENSNNEIGGICEKIFDVMASGCVPIYWGAPNVLDYIPKDAYIDFRDFMDYQKLDEYLKSITEDEYNKFITAISQFMKSDEYYKFTSIGFVKDVVAAIKKAKQLPEKGKSLWEIKWEFFIKIIQNPKIFIGSKKFIYDLFTTW